VNIDQPGRDDVVFDVDHRPDVRLEIRSNRIDFAVAHADVENTVLGVRGIDQPAAFQENIGQLFVHSLIRSEPFSANRTVIVFLIRVCG
jgi:hypothetical protein